MSSFNRFGAAYTGVIALYNGVVVSDFGRNVSTGAPDATVGQANIEAALDRATRCIANSLSPDAFRTITEPDLELIVRRGTAGQTTAQLGVFPIVASSLRLWQVIQGAILPPRDIHKPQQFYDPQTGSLLITPTIITSYTLNATTGALSALSLGADDLMYATYVTSPDDAAFSIPSLADIAVLGAAAELGGNLYVQASDEWKLVEQYRTRYQNAIDDMRDSKTIPLELRRLRWWHDLDPSNRAAAVIPWKRS